MNEVIEAVDQIAAVLSRSDVDVVEPVVFNLGGLTMKCLELPRPLSYSATVDVNYGEQNPLPITKALTFYLHLANIDFTVAEDFRAILQLMECRIPMGYAERTVVARDGVRSYEALTFFFETSKNPKQCKALQFHYKV